MGVWGSGRRRITYCHPVAEIASEMLKGRVFEICLADLNKDEDQAYRKIQLQCEEVQGHYCLTQFYGMNFTNDKLRSMVRKWQTLIEAQVDVKTLDGYVMRLFCIGFTKKRMNQLKKTCYANSSQQKLIRKKMREIMAREASTCDLKELVNKLSVSACCLCLPAHVRALCMLIHSLARSASRK